MSDGRVTSDQNVHPEHRHRHRESTLVLTAIKVVVVAVFMLPLAHYSIFRKTDNAENATNSENENSSTKMNPLIDPSLTKPLKKVIIIEQPSCPLPDPSLILAEICLNLYKKHEECAPEDVTNLEKHKLVFAKRAARNNTSTPGDPRGTIVGCVAAGLLLTSLGAALVELYKAKTGQTPVKNKAPLSRKCSLADLTVLKHNRKELVRRESLLEIPETGNQSQLGMMPWVPPPLYRRSSFPVGPFSYDLAMSESRRTSVDSRRLSIIDSRRNSSTEYGRRISIDSESPERRHYTRLVHRH